MAEERKNLATEIDLNISGLKQEDLMEVFLRLEKLKRLKVLNDETKLRRISVSHEGNEFLRNVDNLIYRIEEYSKSRGENFSSGDSLGREEYQHRAIWNI